MTPPVVIPKSRGSKVTETFGAFGVTPPGTPGAVESLVQTGIYNGTIIVPLDVVAEDPNLIKNLAYDGSVAVGKMVRLVAGTLTAASCNSLEESMFTGICEVISDGVAQVRCIGKTKDVLAGLTANARYFLAADGTLSTTPPVGSGQVVLNVGQAYDSTTFILSPAQRMVRS